MFFHHRPRRPRRHPMSGGAPICAGKNAYHHRPIHCQRRGFHNYHGHALPRWVCPICHMVHVRF